MNDERRQARLAGLLYFLVAVIAPYGLFVAPAKLLVPGDARETALRIAAHPGVLHLGMATELVHQAIEVFMVLVLYALFKPVQRMLAGHPAWLQAFDPAQLDALASLAMQLHAHGLQLAAFFWGLWLLPLGLVMLRSGFIPKAIGWCSIAASGGYVLGASADILVPGLQGMLAAPAFVLQLCEPVMILWLLLGGATRGRALAKAPATA